MRNIINLLKKIRKRDYLKKRYDYLYAFVGIGNHSINNLYPVLHYLNVPLKYIVCRSKESCELVNNIYTSVIATPEYDIVLNDDQIKGIFICADPATHYELTRRALQKGKHVFVEKPPCQSSVELYDLSKLAKASGLHCLCGMQKRYSHCTSLLKKNLNIEKVISYNYRFLIGGYPEGNIYWDLFIHPLDLAIFLFGEMKIISVLKSERDRGQLSVLLQVQHKNIIGNIEISTQYSWSEPKEELTINSSKGVYEMLNHQILSYAPKPNTIFSIPTEKIFPVIPEKQILFNGNSFLPVLQNNQLVAQGYYGEIHTFLELCEDRKAKNISTTETLINTYKIIESLI